MSFKNECKAYYKTYKESCKIIYSDIKCNTNKVIQNMNITQLHDHLVKMKSLKNKSKRCYEYRELYRDNCVDKNLRDEGHEYSIEKAFKYYKICEQELENIYARIIELEKILNDSFKLFNTLENSENSENSESSNYQSDSGSESGSEKWSYVKKK